MPRQHDVLLALAIADQLLGKYEEAIESLKIAAEIDPFNALACNTLAMTQKLMGEYEKAAHNYDAGAKALAFTKLKSLQNSASSPRLPIGESRNHLWCDYAMDAALRFSIQDNVDSLAWPTGDMALRDEKEKTFAGWYWQDKTDHDGKLVRLFTPNYFNNIFHFFLQDGLYANLMGNRSTVLKLLGQDEEAQKHLEEAEDFSFDG